MSENIVNVQETIQTPQEKKLTKKDLIHCFILWEGFTECCLSYERLMSLGFCHAMHLLLIDCMVMTKKKE